MNTPVRKKSQEAGVLEGEGQGTEGCSWHRGLCLHDLWILGTLLCWALGRVPMNGWDQFSVSLAKG